MAELVPLAGPVLAAEHHLEPAGWIEPIDQMGGDIGRPDVVVLVDPQPVRPVEQAVAKPPDEAAIRIKFHQRHRAAMDDKNVSLGIEGDPRRAAEIGVRRKLKELQGRPRNRAVEVPYAPARKR